MLHIGGVRTALFCWLYARRHGGTFILRVEDTDRERSTDAAVQVILDGMAWLGLTPDEGPFYQTKRYDRYHAVIGQLLQNGHAYQCYCSKTELEELRAGQMARKEKPRYDGRWRPQEGKTLPAPPAGIALFDLDGTLLAWDTQLLFRHHVIRREPWRALLLPVFLGSLPLFPILKLGGLKRAFLSYLWRMPAATLAAHARSFAAAIVPTFYPELREALENHRRQGHLLILSSASPEFYVAEIGRALGFQLALGTELPSSSSCPLLPQLLNHKGAAKVERLYQLLPPSYFADGKLHRSHGYTDSRADLPMLALCHSASVVNPDAALAALAHASGWQILRPPRPWRNRADFWWQTLALLTGRKTQDFKTQDTRQEQI